MAGIGINSDLFLAREALQVATLQTATAGSNLANSSTAGATNETVDVTSGDSVMFGGGESIDMGVESVTVSAARSTYLDQLVQTENSNLGSATSLDTFLSQAQNALQESLSTSGTTDQSSSDSGLEAATTAFYTAWTTLGNDPTSTTDQDAVATAAQSFIDTAQSVYNGLQETKQNSFTQATTETTQVNSLVSQIASLNQEIENSEATGVSADGTVNQANQLRDQREADIESLSSLVNINATQDPTNPSIINVSLADSSTPTYSATSSTALNTTIGTAGAGTITVNGTTVNLTSGETLADVADSINSAVSGVTATEIDGHLNLSSTSAVTLADGTSTLCATLGLSSATTATGSTPIYLVSGTFSGGETNSDGTPTYSLTVAGSNADTGDTGYDPNQSLTILATNAANGTVIANPTGGSLGGIVTFDNDVMGVESTTPGTTTLLGQFDTFIQSVIGNVNTAATAGTGTNGAAGENFFGTSSTASTGITDLALNDLYNVSSDTYDGGSIPSGSTAANDDGSTAASIGNSLSNPDILPAYSSMVTDLGAQTSAAATNLSSQQLVSTQATNQQQSYEGISTDDQMTDLLSFQKAFEASSEFINVLDQMYQTVVTGLISS